MGFFIVFTAALCHKENVFISLKIKKKSKKKLQQQFLVIKQGNFSFSFFFIIVLWQQNLQDHTKTHKKTDKWKIEDKTFKNQIHWEWGIKKKAKMKKSWKQKLSEKSACELINHINKQKNFDLYGVAVLLLLLLLFLCSLLLWFNSVDTFPLNYILLLPLYSYLLAKDFACQYLSECLCVGLYVFHPRK